MNTRRSCGADAVLESLVRSAVQAGAPAAVAEEARRITADRLFGERSGRVRDRERAESYFWGVVRRRALRGDAPAIARLMVEASLAAELREAGHIPEPAMRAAI